MYVHTYVCVYIYIYIYHQAASDERHSEQPSDDDHIGKPSDDDGISAAFAAAFHAVSAKWQLV